MIPAYDFNGVRIFQGDCLQVMPTFAAGSVDMILCDLPYGTTACKWDTVIPFEPLWAEYKRLIKPNGAIVLTSSQPFTSALVMSNPKWFKYCWVWKKSSPGGFLNSHFRPMKIVEDILVFSAGGASSKSKEFGKPVLNYFPQGVVPAEISKINNRGKERQRFGYPENGNSISNGKPYRQCSTGYPSDLIEFPRDKGAFHSTQKPVALMEYLIRTYTSEGETVLDNTMGSGTTGVACIRTGRKFVGIEQDETYFCTAKERIASAQYVLLPDAQKRLQQGALDMFEDEQTNFTGGVK